MWCKNDGESDGESDGDNDGDNDGENDGDNQSPPRTTCRKLRTEVISVQRDDHWKETGSR